MGVRLIKLKGGWVRVMCTGFKIDRIPPATSIQIKEGSEKQIIMRLENHQAKIALKLTLGYEMRPGSYYRHVRIPKKDLHKTTRQREKSIFEKNN